MCGILGVVNLSQKYVIDEQAFRAALATLRHRGPDAEDLKRFGDEVILGHTRLSIIDLGEQSNQPLSIRDRYWIVFNGEIFNYIEIRKDLELLGARFRTSSDTEVLLHAFAQWGTACVDRFNGMWAFAIYDTLTRTLFCSRDRYGEKPFSYVIDNGQLLFASEIKAILAYRPSLAEPDYNAISNFCRTSVGAQQPQTWFRGIVRLPAGHNMIVKDGRVQIQRYWRYPTNVSRGVTFDEARAQYAALFKDAVRLRMRSDVPLGLTLSSGIDSTSIAYAMHAVTSRSHHCFTARYNPQDALVSNPSIYTHGAVPIDESTTATKVAGKLDFHSHVVDTDYHDLVSSLGRVIFYLECGNSSPAVIPLMQVLTQARQYVRVLLDGQGADELLGGYVGNLLWPAIIDLIANGQLAEAIDSFRQFSRVYKPAYAIKMVLRDMSNDLHLLSTLHQRLTAVGKAYGPVLQHYVRIRDYPELPGEGCLGRVSRCLMHQHSGGLVNLIHYGDALSMANGIESRMPFLDHRLVEFVWTLPSEFKVKVGIGKHLHRQAMRGFVPDWILDQKHKLGFNTPIGSQWEVDRSDVESPVEALLNGRCVRRGVFDQPGLHALVNAHRAGRHDHSTLLFRLLSVELWFRQFIDAPASQRCAALRLGHQPMDPVKVNLESHGA